MGEAVDYVKVQDLAAGAANFAKQIFIKHKGDLEKIKKIILEEFEELEDPQMREEVLWNAEWLSFGHVIKKPAA